jgi:hypothetical protein
MIKRILVNGLLVSMIQIAIYFVLLKSIQFFQTFTITENHRELISNFHLEISTILFSAIVAIQNISTTLINKKWYTWTGFSFAIFFYLVGWGEDLNSWPIKTLLFLLVGIFTLSMKFYIDKKLINL